MSELLSRPIGIFDSGIGGLTVFRELAARLPRESLLYFGDTARVPYGPKSPETVQRYSREAAALLLSRGVKMIVVACNTATAHALDVLRREVPVPVIGVIGAGARAAVAATVRGRVGVIGTAGTIGSGAYDLAVRDALRSARVYAQPCPLFVPLVEEGMAAHTATRLVAEEYLAPLREVDVDVLILGCTHYPVLQELLANVMGPAVRLVDSAAETALEVAQELEQLDLVNPGSEQPVHQFMVSDLPLRFREVGRRFVGDVIGDVERIDIDRYLSAAEPSQ
ncbi:MAG: glutamate racemase [Longimicrobiales bacterium]